MSAVVIAFAVVTVALTAVAVWWDRVDARRHRDVYAAIAERQRLIDAMEKGGRQ